MRKLFSDGKRNTKEPEAITWVWCDPFQKNFFLMICASLQLCSCPCRYTVVGQLDLKQSWRFPNKSDIKRERQDSWGFKAAFWLHNNWSYSVNCIIKERELDCVMDSGGKRSIFWCPDGESFLDWKVFKQLSLEDGKSGFREQNLKIYSGQSFQSHGLHMSTEVHCWVK